MRIGIFGNDVVKVIVAGFVITVLAWAPVWASEPGAATWLGATASLAAAEEETPVSAEAAPEWTKSCPFSIGVDYTLVSDYVWRGVNLSEYRGEGRERPNHQMNVGMSYDTGNFGSINAGFWFEWYGGQKAMDSSSDGHLQEVDYTLSWSYDIEPLAMGVEVGWIAYQFPQASGDLKTTHELFLGLSFDDSKLFGTESSVLNPTVKYYYDIDLVEGGQFLEFGISHDFALADMGCGQTPILKDLTVTPSVTLGVDHRYFTGRPNWPTCFTVWR